MESVKSVLLLIVLAAVGYGVYVALNHAPPSEPPATAEPIKITPPAAKAARNSLRSPLSTPAVAADPAASPSTPSAAASSLPFGIGASGMQPPTAPPTQPPTSPPTQPPPIASNQPISPPVTPASPPDALRATPPTNDMASIPPTAPSTSNLPAIPAAPPDRATREFAAAVQNAQSQLAVGKLVEALRDLSKWYDNPALDLEDQDRLVDLLGQLAGTVIYSRDHWLVAPYVVQQGDSLEAIASSCQVPWQLLAKINGIDDPRQLAPGEQLKVVRGPFNARLNAKDGWLALFVDGLYAGRFRVQTAGEMNADGTLAVSKVGPETPGGNSNRYIDLGGSLQLRLPDDPAASPGVVRIGPRDMQDVYDMLSERSQVTVRR